MRLVWSSVIGIEGVVVICEAFEDQHHFPGRRRKINRL
jgi:hypothetical protein